MSVPDGRAPSPGIDFHVWRGRTRTFAAKGEIRSGRAEVRRTGL